MDHSLELLGVQDTRQLSRGVPTPISQLFFITKNDLKSGSSRQILRKSDFVLESSPAIATVLETPTKYRPQCPPIVTALEPPTKN